MRPNTYSREYTKFLCSLKACDRVKTAYGDRGFSVPHAGKELRVLWHQICQAIIYD